MDPSDGTKTSGSSGTRKPSPSEEQEQDDPVFHGELQDFREKWQKELLSSSERVKGPEETAVAKLDVDDENKAKTLFLRGVDMERSGKLYEAIQFYRKAIQLVPDIEFKLHNLSAPPKEKQPDDSLDENYERAEISSGSDRDSLNEYDLLPRIETKNSICTPAFEQKNTHISVLPLEIILYILRWVVSTELDLRSLEMFGLGCRGFYLCARDSEIWRLACLKVWGVHCGKTPGTFGNWRQMFISRARLRFNGCYISKTTYIRHGENSFQDQFYRPWHLIAYYRYFRFFPEGTVLMLTSADEPSQCVAQLRHRNPKSPVLSGYYRLKDDKVTIVVHKLENLVLQNFKRNRRREHQDTSNQSFDMELQIMGNRNKRHVQLQWTHYSVRTKTKRGDENVCNFDLVANKFPPLWFSRVKSYTIESENPLV